MGWWFMPIRLPTADIKLKADRRLVFQVLTAWGAAGPDGKPVSKVLREQDGRKLIEFKTAVRGVFGRPHVNTTQEWVRVREPERIDFHGHKGPMPVLRDRFTLEEWGNCCVWKYDSTYALHGSILGWIVGMLYVRPLLMRFMREHQEELQQTIETRASRSRQYPRQPCPGEEEARDPSRQGGGALLRGERESLH